MPELSKRRELQALVAAAIYATAPRSGTHDAKLAAMVAAIEEADMLLIILENEQRNEENTREQQRY